MSFNEQLPKWENQGAEPPESKKTDGWEPTEKPPAQWFNWLFHRIYRVLEEIRNKVVVKEEGKGLSTNDYTDAEKDKLAGIEKGAEKNKVTSVNKKTGAVNLTKADLGLSNVINVEQASKVDLDNLKDEVEGRLDNLKDDVDAHKAESVSHLIVVTRDLSLEGIQSISCPFKPKSLIGLTFVPDTKKESIGIWAEGIQRVRRAEGEGLFQGSVRFVEITGIDINNVTRGVIQNVTNNGFEINWERTAEGAIGTATIYILAQTHAHGGV